MRGQFIGEGFVQAGDLRTYIHSLPVSIVRNKLRVVRKFMAQTIFLICIALIFAILGLNERRFSMTAQQHAASITVLFTSVHSKEDMHLSKRDEEIAKQATVKLNPTYTDGRVGDIVVPPSVWQSLRIGDIIQVWAFADLPRWVFWSPMIRYKKRDIWVKINFTIMTIVMGFALWSHIYSLR